MAAEAKIVISAEDRTRAAFASAEKGLGRVNELATMAGFSLAGLGSAVTLGGLAAMVKGVSESVDALNDVRDATGSSIENISALEAVALRNGHTFETVGSALIKFNQVLGQTSKPGSEAERVLKALGLSAKELRDLDPAEALRRTAVAMSGFEEEGEKARASQVLLGKSLREIAPLLGDLAHEGSLVATTTTEQAEAAEAFNKQLSAMNSNLTLAGREFVGEFLPAMTDVVKSFRDGDEAAGGFAKTAGSAVKIVFQTLAAMGREVSFVFQGVGRDIGGMAAQLAALARGDFRGFSEIGRALKEDAARARRENDAAIARIMGTDLMGVEAGDAVSRRLGRQGPVKPSVKVPWDDAEAKKAADKQVQEARRVAEERQKLRNEEYAQVIKFHKDLEDDAKKLADAQIELAQRNSREYLAARDAEVLAASELANAAQWQVDIYGKSRREIEQLTLARLEDSKQQRLMTALTLEDVQAIEAWYQARRKAIGAEGQLALLEENKRSADAAALEWERIGDSLTDNLMRGGKSAAQYLKDLFRTLVLRPILAPVGQAVSGVMTAATGSPASAGGMLGSLSNLGSLANMATGVGTGFAGMVGSGIGSIFGTAAGNAALGGSLGLGAGSATAAASAASVAGGGAAVGGTAMATLGAAAPYLAAALAVAALLSGSFKGETRVGGRYRDAEFTQGPSGGAISGATEAITATITSINATLQSLGSAARLTELVSGLEQSERGKGFAFAGGTLSTGVAFGQNYDTGHNNRRGSMTAEQAMAAFGEELKQATLQALQAADVPGMLGDWLRSLGDIDALSGGALDTAYNRLQKAMTERQTLEERLYALTTPEVEQLARARQRERDALDESNLALYDQVVALEEQKAAAETAAEALRELKERAKSDLLESWSTLEGFYQQVIDKNTAYAASLKQLRLALTSGPMAMLSPEAQYNQARTEFQRLSSLGANDPERLEKLAAAGEAFAEASKAYNASSTAYFADRDAIVAALAQSELHAKANVDVATLELEVQRKQLVEMGLIKQAITTLAEAQAAFAASLSSFYSAGGGSGGGGGGGAGGLDMDSARATSALFQQLLGRTPEAGAFDFYSGWDEQAIRNAILNSPEYLGKVPKMDTGTNYLPRDMLVYAHKGEAIVPRRYNPAAGGGGSEEVVAALRQEFRALTTVVAAGARQNNEELRGIRGNTSAIPDAAIARQVQAVPA